MTKLELDQAFMQKVRHLVLDKDRSIRSIAKSTFRKESYVRGIVEQIRREREMATAAVAEGV